ncbi:MAG: trypsin-like peptidase domain-containing protein, partial [Gemmatimonadales bacterium]
MKPQLRIVTGNPAGTVLVYSHHNITIGRHPDSDVAFDAHQDLEVSVRHAAIFKQADRWYVRDMGSRNGTLVNGHKVTADTALNDTDQIQLGAGGPVIECRLVGDHVPDTERSPPATAGRMRPTPLANPAPVAQSGRSTTHRVRVEVARQTRRLRGVSVGLFVVLVAVVAGFLYIQQQQRAAQEQELALLQAQIDSVLQTSLATVAALQEEMTELATTLEDSRQEIQALQGQLTRARESGNAERIQTLSLELENALTTLAQQQHAASIDFASITRANQRAVAMIFVDFGDGTAESSTAFAVRSDGTMITTRHSVVGPNGDRRASRIGVRFADSRQTFPAHVVAIAEGPDADVAVIRVELQGEVPTIQGLNQRPDTVPVGAPVAIIGFPGGMASPQRVQQGEIFATASLTAGTLSKNLPELLQINGYGTHGASGSPILDANGQVIGILNAGEVGSGGRIVF